MRNAILFGTAALAMTLALPAAASTFDRDVEQVKGLQVSGQDFTGHLAREYKDLSTYESEVEYDWVAADLYAEKAFMAAEGTRVVPFNPKYFWVGDARDDLDTARQRLVTALDGGGAGTAPELAAAAQARYDCWVEQQEEGWQVEQIAACRNGFETAMTRLDEAMRPQPVAQPAPQPQVRTETVTEPVTAATTVYFGFDEATIAPDEQRKIDAFVAAIDRTQHVRILVTGHTDTAGPSDYNLALSERRADAVREALRQEGLTVVDVEELELEAYGEQRPAVETGDGVREQANRRVEMQGYAEVSRQVRIQQ